MVEQPFAVVETHVSLLVFLPEHVLKLKKPIVTPFLDQSTPQLRRAWCEDEVRLNRRLAPDVYLGVVPLAAEGGAPVDHAVLMRRLPASARLATIASSGDGEEHVRAVARTLAAFHARADRGPHVEHYATPEAIRSLWTTSFAEMTPSTQWLLPAAGLARCEALALRYLDGRRPLLESRLAAGCAVDGHGDLLAEDIFCLPDGPRLLDCLEFSDRFRYGDVLLDAAMLAMDLERIGRPDLAVVFLAAYAEFGHEVHPPSLAHHYVAYRALVRSKVACLRASQGDAAAGEQAEHLLARCESHLVSGAVRLVLVGGLPGTGKSTLAESLGEQVDATVIRSDVVRKELAGLAATEHAGGPYGEGLYTPDVTDTVYDELLRRAEVALGLGETVVLDASWSATRHREAAAALARRASADLVTLRCTAPAALAARRLRERAAAGTDASDADELVAVAMASRFDPWPEAVEVDGTGGTVTALASARRAFDAAYA